MSYRLCTISLCLFSVFSVLNGGFLQRSILEENSFSLNARCNMPMLGQTRAELQVDKNSHVLAIVDVAKNFADMGIPNNSETNPENAKNIDIVFRGDLNQIGLFWSKTNDEVLVSRPPNDIMEIVTSCAIWMKDIIIISNTFKNATPAPLVKDEMKFGNKKFTFKNTLDNVEYGYIFQDDNLTAITQIRPPEYGLLANLILFVDSSKSMNLDEMMPIPEGIQYDDLN